MIAAIGTITRDRIFTDGKEMARLGGAPFFFSKVCSRLDVPHKIISHISREDASHVPCKEGLILGDRTSELIIRETSDDTSCEVVHFTGKIPLQQSHLAGSRLCLISTLFDEVMPEDLAAMHPQGRLALDLQGFTRKKGRFLSDKKKRQPKGLGKLVSFVSILKCNELESRIICGDVPIEDRLNFMSRLGPKTVLITLGENGIAVFDHGDVFTSPVQKRAVASTVGAGDILFSAFLAFLDKGDSVKEAVSRAMALTGDILEENI
ncbi:MAG: PfkB family carbohydrate kinase [Nanoarchaeota archaeon]